MLRSALMIGFTTAAFTLAPVSFAHCGACGGDEAAHSHEGKSYGSDTKDGKTCTDADRKAKKAKSYGSDAKNYTPAPETRIEAVPCPAGTTAQPDGTCLAS